MADPLQSTQTTTTTTPDWYNKSMSDAAQKAATAGTDALNSVNGPNSAYDPNDLQQQAFTNVAANVGNYQPGLTQAGQTLNQAGSTDITGAASPFLKAGTTTSGLDVANKYLTSGTSSAADLVGNYMSPFTQSVVDQIGLANQQNIQQNLSPGITAGAAGSGQFGSQRGANALAMGISNANLGALGQQTSALQAGYTEALKAAEQQRLNQLTAGNTAGTLQNQANVNNVTAGNIAGTLASDQATNLRNTGTAQAALAQQTQSQGLADTNALATLGGQKQTIAQNKLFAPLDILGKQTSVMSGANIPTTSTTTLNPSTLSTIATLGSTAGGIMQQPVVGKNADGTPIYGTSLYDKLKAEFGSSTPNTPNATSIDTTAAGVHTPPPGTPDPLNWSDDTGTMSDGTWYPNP
jgi:hypothetical protein